MGRVAGEGCGVEGALTCPPVSSVWVEEVRVESIWLGEPLQMATNTVNLVGRQA